VVHYIDYYTVIVVVWCGSSSVPTHLQAGAATTAININLPQQNGWVAGNRRRCFKKNVFNSHICKQRTIHAATCVLFLANTNLYYVNKLL